MNEMQLDILRLKNQGFCCSQIMMHMALDIQGSENPGLLRAMTGLCKGSLSQRGTCGVFTGAACILGLYAGKGLADDEADERLPLMLAALEQWFEGVVVGKFGGSKCADIVDDFKPDMAICGKLIEECFGQTMAILVENGFDPADSRND
ncbi:MAG: C-GCAxxG-C-C family protein [Desulforhopalus sp.]|nr:C-GCAxxG-C-C family protein [Desulforhopalus sp.]